MPPCPVCPRSSLVELQVEPGVTVEVCPGCKGLLLDEEALGRLAGGASVAALSEPRGPRRELAACLRCNTREWEGRALPGEERSDIARCQTCGLLFLGPGEVDRLRERALAERRAARARRSAAPPSPTHEPAPAPPSAAASEPGAPESPFDRLPIGESLADVAAVPLALALSLLFCSRPVGRFFGALVGMPFHELGHALTSWLSSRFAVPLPFFTVWHLEQSWLVGLVVAAALGGFALRCSRERRPFGLAVALALLLSQLTISWLVPARVSAMLQVLGGALGEIALGGLLLLAFHFPLPDRLRWDFWRWPALLPGALCFGQALLLWARAAGDARLLPWGSAIGDESDGDMNRLVSEFGWTAAELSSFYLGASCLAAAALAGAQALAVRRFLRARRHAPAARALVE